MELVVDRVASGQQNKHRLPLQQLATAMRGAGPACRLGYTDRRAACSLRQAVAIEQGKIQRVTWRALLTSLQAPVWNRSMPTFINAAADLVDRHCSPAQPADPIESLQS